LKSIAFQDRRIRRTERARVTALPSLHLYLLFTFNSTLTPVSDSLVILTNIYFFVKRFFNAVVLLADYAITLRFDIYY